jgi:tetratricopeptide (TPR) repeat protein
MNSNIEELYLEAEQDIKNSAFYEAFRKHQSILFEEPNHAPAHNSLGWLLKNQFDDYAGAEKHFKAAMKADPHYPHPYFHYAILLTDLERYEDLKKHLAFCMTIPTIDKAWVYARRGIVLEMQQHFPEAISEYENAILISLNDEKIKDYNADIERCKMKMEILKRK